MTKIPRPCKEEVEKYLKEWDNNETIMYHDKCLKLLFEEIFPENKKIEHIIIKVNTLNDFYSAGVLDKEIIPLSKHIYELDIDDRLKRGCLTVVDDILKAKDVRRVYSFATKYCSQHNPEVYPIYDSYVKKVLMTLKKQDNFAEFKENDLKDYETFNKVLDDFKRYYGLEYSKKELDQYLWLLGIHTFKKSSKFISSSESAPNHQ